MIIDHKLSYIVQYARIVAYIENIMYEFRVSADGGVEWYDSRIGFVGDWVCLPECISAEDEEAIRKAGFKAMGIKIKG